MTQQLKTRSDGSIDTAFYIARGRQARSQAAHDMFRSTPRQRNRSRGNGFAALVWTLVAITIVAVPGLLT